MIRMNFDMELLFTTSSLHTLILISDCPFKHDFIWFLWIVQFENDEWLLEETSNGELSDVWKRNLAKAEQWFFLSTGITLYNWGIELYYFLMLFSPHAALCLVCVDCSTQSKVDHLWKGKIDMLIFLYVFCFKMIKLPFLRLCHGITLCHFEMLLSHFRYNIDPLCGIRFGSGRLLSCEMVNDYWKEHLLNEIWQRENWRLWENEIWQRENCDFNFRLE